MSENKTEKQCNYFVTLMKTYLKSNRKGIRFSLLFTILLFVFASTLLLTWFSYQNVTFQNYSTEINWFSNQEVSSFTKYTKIISNDISADYLDSALLDVQELYESEFPDIVSEISGTIEVLFRGPDPLYGDLVEYSIKTFDNETMNVLTSEIISGNLPQNHSEFLLLYTDFIYQDYFDINDTVQLKPDLLEIDFNNFSISGVITDLEASLELYNYSPDLVLDSHRNERYGYYTPSRNIQTFITTPNYLFQLLNNFTQYSGTIVTVFDIQFNETAINYSNVKKYKDKLTEWMEGVELPFDDQVSIKIGADLLDVFVEFQQTWVIETIKISMTAIIIFLLLILVIYESISYNKTELHHTFRLMKIQGLDDKKITKTVFIESLIIAVISYLIGLIFSIGVGYVLVTLLKLKISFSFFVSALLNPLFLIITSSLFCLIFFISFCLKINYMKKSKVDINEHLKEKERKGIKKIFTSFELITLIVGALILSGSIPGIIIFSNSELFLNMSILNTTLFAFLLLGSLFFLISLISLFSRLITFGWSLLGKFLWKKNNSIFSLSLKNIAQSYHTYQKVMVISILIGFSMLPGFIIYPSVNNHLETNSYLASSYSDLVIFSWNADESIEQSINSLSGINRTTTTTQLKFNSVGIKNVISEVDILTINATEFASVVNMDKLESLNQQCFDFNFLKNNMTCYINTQFANAFGYSPTNEISVQDFWNSEYEFQLSPIEDFEQFPLIPNYNHYLGEKLFDDVLHIQLVLDFTTSEEITKFAYGITPLHSEQQLLIKLSDGANITEIQDQIYNEFNIIAKSFEDIQNSFYNEIADINLNLIVISSIVSIFVLIFIGYITGQEIFQQRLRNIEADYRLGATKRQLLFEYSLEISLISLLPLIFSMVIGLLTSQYYHLFLNVDISYSNFKLWIPWWLVILIFILSYISIFSGWYSNIYTNIRKYKPTKQE